MNTTSNKIVVPVDFGDQAQIAFEQALHLARVIKGDITLLYVIESSGLLGRFSGAIHDEELKKEINTKMTELLASVADKGDIKFDTVIAHGSVYEKVAEVAEMLNARFIVMGTNGGKGKIRRRFIGSNALRVVRESKVPVITIKGKAHREGCKNIVLPLDLTKETREKVAKAIEFAKLYSSCEGNIDIRVNIFLMCKGFK